MIGTEGQSNVESREILVEVRDQTSLSFLGVRVATVGHPNLNRRRVIRAVMKRIFLCSVPLVLGSLGLALSLGSPSQAANQNSELCNRDRYLERNVDGNPQAYRYACRHDAQSPEGVAIANDTYRAAYVDGKRWQHQDQVKKGNTTLRYYYGQISADNKSWQWEEFERFDTGNYDTEAPIKVRQYAQRSANGAWQNEYQWRNQPNGPLHTCYSHSALSPNHGRRTPVHTCTINNRPAGGNEAPIQMRNPKFRQHEGWE